MTRLICQGSRRLPQAHPVKYVVTSDTSGRTLVFRAETPACRGFSAFVGFGWGCSGVVPDRSRRTFASTWGYEGALTDSAAMCRGSNRKAPPVWAGLRCGRASSGCPPPGPRRSRPACCCCHQRPGQRCGRSARSCAPLLPGLQQPPVRGRHHPRQRAAPARG